MQSSNAGSWHRTELRHSKMGWKIARSFGVRPVEFAGCVLGVNVDRRMGDGTKGLQNVPFRATERAFADEFRRFASEFGCYGFAVSPLFYDQ